MKKSFCFTLLFLSLTACGNRQLQQAQAQLESARSNLSYTELISPSDGVVGSLPYRVGDYVGPSIPDGLTTVADNTQMYVYFSLTERDVTARIRESGSMDKMIESFPVLRLQTAGITTNRYRPDNVRYPAGRRTQF